MKRKLIVRRGGAWNYFPSNLRSAGRYGYPPTLTYTRLGFRIALRKERT